MTFSEQLNYYMKLLSCQAKELSELSGLSGAVISRYRNGSRIPAANSKHLEDLSAAIALLAGQKGIPSLSKESVLEAFQTLLTAQTTGFPHFSANFNHILEICQINQSELARYLNYDASYLSRIRSGSRSPSDPTTFCRELASYLFTHCSKQTLQTVSSLLSLPEPADASCFQTQLTKWLLSHIPSKQEPVEGFLEKMDQFNLNDYIRSIHFDEWKVPSMPISLPISHSYQGLQGFMTAELNYLKATVLSKSMEDVTMYSDMPMTELSKDPDFPKKWMFGMGMLLKKGLHLNLIHNIDRPIYEMMLGLESHIPMYMTGQIRPYYLPKAQNDVFYHFLKVSGTVALSGEAIAGHHADGLYYLTNKKEEVVYYKKRAKALLTHARPLMKIFRSDSRDDYERLLKTLYSHPVQRSIYTSLPLHTISEDLLEQLFEYNSVSSSVRSLVRAFLSQKRTSWEETSDSISIRMEVPKLSREEFEAHPIRLFLADFFLEDEIVYSYDLYQEHMRLTKAYAASHPNYALIPTAPAFRNLQIRIFEGACVLILKGTSPAIHFAIEHPKLREALEKLFIPIKELD